WLKECLSNHADCPKPSIISAFIPSRVIDVGDSDGSQEPYLLKTQDQYIPEAEKRYVALSHCWGTAQIITTKLLTLSDRYRGIPMATLPRTFQDAVIVTRKLGLRYLWIDSLCIIQDSDEDWENESVQMCNIYHNALFTVSAAHASNSSTGCFFQRDGLLHLPFELSFPLAESEGDTIKTLFAPLPRQQILNYHEPPLYGRAWVLQEQVLSPRMLIYDGDQLRWECLTMHGSERSPLGGVSRHIGASKAIRKGITDSREDFFILAEFDEEFPPRYQHQDWCYAVMDYTHRGMTNQSDRLIAISGIAEAIQRRTKNVYVSGLWQDQLALGLLWNIPFEPEFTPTTMFAFTIPPSTRHDKAIAPSWSWASV
ncbi:HET-domain-containing protein, partial [Glonium stellatum]